MMAMEPMFQVNKKNATIMKTEKASSPVVLSQDIPPGTKMTFVDISHNLSTIDIKSDLNVFSALIDCANLWLRRNSQWRAISFQTVPLIFKNEKLNAADYGATKRLLRAFTDYDLGEIIILKSLRMWIKKLDDFTEIKKNIEIKTIKYLSLLPKSCQYPDGQVGWETLDDVVKTVNEMISNKEIKGRILNVECVNYDADDEWTIDPECPFQKELTTKQLTVMRVYYECGNPCDDHLSLMDFIPSQLYGNNILAQPKYETLNTVLNRVTQWLNENSNYKFLSAQCIDLKFKGVEDIQNRLMVHINDIGFYIRIVRVVSIKKTVPPESVAQPQPSKPTKHCPVPVHLETKCFEITQHSTIHGPFYPVKRAIEEFMEKEEWGDGEKNKWSFLFAETISIMARDENDAKRKKDACFYSNRPNVLLVPRLYFLIRFYYDTGSVGCKYIKADSIDMEKVEKREQMSDAVNNVRRIQKAKSCRLM